MEKTQFISPDNTQPELFEWQRDHAARLIDSLVRHGYSKDGSDTGTGKTVVSIAVAKSLGLTPFVICPKAVVPSWKEWIKRFGYENVHAWNYEKLRRGNTDFYQNGEFRLNAKGVLLIFDEDHRCKGSKSENAKMMVSAKRAGYKILMLGATSCTNPIEMRALGYVLELHNDRGWWNWCLKNGCKRGTFGGLKFVGSKAALKRIHDHIYKQGRGSRIRVKDLPPGSFPDSLISADGYDIESRSAIELAYSDLKADLLALDDKREGDDMDSPLVLQLRARQEVELLKVPLFESLARDALEEGNAVAIFVNFRDTLEGLHRRLAGEHEISLIHGGQDDYDRVLEIRKFQQGGTRICLCMTQAGGTGISLHDETGEFPRVSLISPSFSAVDLRQVLGRIHRAGSKSHAVQKIVFANDTVEMRVCKAVRQKLNNLDLINDDEMNPVL